jgi:hypothetical protein
MDYEIEPPNRILRRMIRFILVMLIVSLASVSSPGAAAEEQAEEYAVKAAFLYNFARFTEWPASAFPGNDSPIVVCILGDDPFGSAIDFLRDKTINGRRVVLKREKNAERLEPCQVLFVSRSKEDELEEILSAASGWCVLTVSDMERFAHKGGGIGFVREGNKVRFEVNPETTKKAGLGLSSKLLSLALLVNSHNQQAGGS